MNEITVPIHHKIYTLRGKQIILDSDLAVLYSVETRRLNEQVKRNSESYPDDFMFQLSEEEYENFKSQFTTSSLELREFTLHYNALGKQLIELERKNDKKFKEVFTILDTLVDETKKTDEKVMGFIK